jgi:hypothetical protein
MAPFLLHDLDNPVPTKVSSECANDMVDFPTLSTASRCLWQ